MTYVALTCGILLAGVVALVIIGAVALAFTVWALCAAGAMADKARLNKRVDDGEDWP